jgi:hypothetical protein
MGVDALLHHRFPEAVHGYEHEVSRFIEEADVDAIPQGGVAYPGGLQVAWFAGWVLQMALLWAFQGAGRPLCVAILPES